MDLKDKFKEIVPRENAGSMSANRFDFQKNWAICKLIELTKEGKDFVLAFEFHEDIIVLDSSTSPKYIDFYQIKTKNSGKFTLNALLKNNIAKSDETIDKGTDSTKKVNNSILGKLFFNAVNFQEETKSLNIVCNSHYSFKNKNTSEQEQISLLDLEEQEKKLIIDKISIELEINWLQDILKLVNFNKTNLTINEHEAITKNLLNNFIEEKFSSEVKYNPSLLYRSIFDEVNRKNNFEKTINNLDEVLKYKAIDKEHFEKILSITITEPNKLDKLKEVIFTQLNNANIDISELLEFKEAWCDIEVELLKINNNYFIQTKGLISKILKEKRDLLKNNLLTALDLVYLEFKKEKKDKHEYMYSEHFLKIIILLEIYG